MSGPDWRDDDEALDALIRGLGDPEAATPRTSASEILARAATLAPVPAPAGLAGWKLAATLAVAVGGGFAAGVWFTQRPDASGLAQVETGAAKPSEGAQGGRVEAQAVEQPASTAPMTASALGPERAPSPVRTMGQPRARRSADEQAVAPEASPVVARVEPQQGAGNACPEPGPDAPTFEDLSPLLAVGPMAVDPAAPREPAPEPTPEEAVALAPRPADDPSEEGIAEVHTRGSNRIGARVGVGPLLAPGTSAGLQVAGAVLHQPEPDADRGWVAGGDLDVGMFSGRSGANWTMDLGGELSRAWRLGNVELDAGWTASARLVVPTRREEQEEGPRLEEIEALDKPAVFPSTGPQLGLALGDASANRLSLTLSGQATRSESGYSPWVSLTVGATFGDLRIRDEKNEG